MFSPLCWVPHYFEFVGRALCIICSWRCVVFCGFSKPLILWLLSTSPVSSLRAPSLIILIPYLITFRFHIQRASFILRTSRILLLLAYNTFLPLSSSFTELMSLPNSSQTLSFSGSHIWSHQVGLTFCSSVQSLGILCLIRTYFFVL